MNGWIVIAVNYEMKSFLPFHRGWSSVSSARGSNKRSAFPWYFQELKQLLLRLSYKHFHVISFSVKLKRSRKSEEKQNLFWSLEPSSHLPFASCPV